ncbi:MAG: hypothetical protein ACREP1_06510, partial [Rhodanobacteraceae bacterium]
YLLARLCDRVLWLDGGAWGVLEGGYDAYEARQRKRAPRDGSSVEEPRDKASRATPLRERSQLESRIAKVEREIAALDERKREIDRLFASVELYEDRAQVQSLQDEVLRIGAQSEAALQTWETLLDRLAAMA